MPTKKTHETIACKHVYPLIHGAKEQPSSKADATGLSQQFIDRGLQKEIGLHRRTSAPPAGQTGWLFKWKLSFYIHPGMRHEIDIEPKDLPDLVDYLHALAVGIGPHRVDHWCQFHTLGAMGQFVSGREVVRYLKSNYYEWSVVEKNIVRHGITAYAPGGPNGAAWTLIT